MGGTESWASWHHATYTLVHVWMILWYQNWTLVYMSTLKTYTPSEERMWKIAGEPACHSALGVWGWDVDLSFSSPPPVDKLWHAEPWCQPSSHDTHPPPEIRRVWWACSEESWRYTHKHACLSEGVPGLHFFGFQLFNILWIQIIHRWACILSFHFTNRCSLKNKRNYYFYSARMH